MDEKKTYDFKGTVTISTDEYRDLITDCATYKAGCDDYRSKYWNEQNKVKVLESNLAAVKAEAENLRAFIEAKKETRLAFKLFVAGVEEGDDA
ncbi:MAG: hypothetical protein IJ418_02420 [Clostridia bacterium]|nr:hypothetical protein [Clostridia bacterium]